SEVFHFYIDQEFIKTYGIELLAGRNFREDETFHPFDDNVNNPLPVIVNKKVLESLGYKEAEDAIGQLIYFARGTSDWKAEIIGIVENHHQRSLKDGYDPIMFFHVKEYGGQYFSINLHMQNVSETLSFVEEQYKAQFPGNQFEYFFLDDFFDRQYAADQQFGKVFSLFSSLALFVAALGLFGLSTFMISQRTKEIAVRKVLGAKIAGMVYLFSKDFVKLILVANIIALPVVYFLAKDWLNNFAFQVNIHWIIFVIPVLILLIISLSTVSFQTIKTSLINPIRSLRSD
ncbi:MAG: FtsX-like permease family protein, partial [Bacteroidota bacterium]